MLLLLVQEPHLKNDTRRPRPSSLHKGYAELYLAGSMQRKAISNIFFFLFKLKHKFNFELTSKLESNGFKNTITAVVHDCNPSYVGG